MKKNSLLIYIMSCQDFSCGEKKKVQNKNGDMVEITQKIVLPGKKTYLQNDVIDLDPEIKQLLIDNIFGKIGYDEVIDDFGIIDRGIIALFDTISCKPCSESWTSCPKTQENSNYKADMEESDDNKSSNTFTYGEADEVEADEVEAEADEAEADEADERLEETIIGGGKPLGRHSAKKNITIQPCDSLKYYAEQELNSTAYMLKVLTESIIVYKKNVIIINDKGHEEIKKKGKGTISFEIDESKPLTGRWDKDKENIKISGITYDKQYIEPQIGGVWFKKDNYVLPSVEENGTKGKLIMGFGPSASGKSFMAEHIIKVMSLVDPTFPQVFLNIDGGEYRKYSTVYQRVLKTIETHASTCYIGIENLKKSIDTTKIKKNITDYLIEQKKNNINLQINLYVPDTLNTCATSRKEGCMSNIEKYLNITNGYGDWIAMMIYQHITVSDCPFKPEYQCESTTIKGKSREKCESKKYDDGLLGSNYKFSYITGNSYLDSNTYSTKMKPKYMFRIHNPGIKGKDSILEDLSHYSSGQEKYISTFMRILSQNGIQYINNKVKYNKKCKDLYREEKVSLCKSSKYVNANTTGLFEEMFNKEHKTIINDPTMALPEGYEIPTPEPEESIVDGGRKHKKTKKQRRTKKKKNRNKKKTRKFKYGIKKKTIKKKKYA